MKKIASLLIVALSFAVTSAFACGEKVSEDSKQSTPVPPKTSNTLN